jgi:hypothetical protein
MARKLAFSVERVKNQKIVVNLDRPIKIVACWVY